MFGRLFGKSGSKTPSSPQNTVITDTDDALGATSAPVFLKRQGGYTRQAHLAQYQLQPSFVDRLPWVEFLDDHKALLLEDGRSVGAVFELSMIGTEGRSTEFLANVRTQVCNAIQDSFAELDSSPWVVQFYCQDDEMSMEYEDVLRGYVRPSARGTEFTEQWLKIMGKHLRDVSKPGGLFEDKAVTGTQWRGQQRRTRMVIYRYVEKHVTLDQALEDLNATCDSATNSLLGAGVRCKRLDGQSIHQWLLRWFNPAPADYDDPEEFYRACHYTVKETSNPDDLYLTNDFAETLLVDTPRTDNGYWYFDACPHEVVVVDSLRRAPEVLSLIHI